ncbi:MAG: protein kinase [Polyangiales bacterium]
MLERSATPMRRAPYAATSRYEIGEVLATGGMGVVYRGFDNLAKRPTAYKRIKVTSESSRSRLAALFKNEYDTLAHLAHPNIVEVFDFGLDAYGPYYTMELLSGDDLTALAPLPVAETCRCARDVASALALLHARCLVHRDVSPNNIRLRADGRAKLIDFGGLTKFGTPSELIGTPAFIAPECLTDAALDGRTDLYALGAVMYWTLTQRTHVRARTLDELVEAWSSPPLPPSHYAPHVPPALDELVMSLLQHDPVARPSSAAHVMERLTSIGKLAPEDDANEVAYSYLRHTPLRGRDDATATLMLALRNAITGAGEVVVIESEQGLGRTALLDQLSVEAHIAGATVVRAQGGLHTASFSAARALVEGGLRIYRDVDEHTRSLSSHVDLESTGEVVPRRPHSPIEASERQARIATYLRDALHALSLRNPLVLLVDDAHRVDAETLALFASMLDDLRGHPILLVLATKAGELTLHPEAYTKLAARARRCQLSPLTAQEVSKLVATTFGGVPNSSHLAAWLYTQAGGNPAHTMDLTKLLLAEGAITYALGTFTLPFEYAGVSAGEVHERRLRGTLSGLTADASKLAYVLALHTGPLTAAQLARACAVETPALLLAMGPLVHRGIAVSSGESYSCASEGLRATLRDACTPAEQRETHVALAEALAREDQGVLTQRLATAYHLLHAGPAQTYEGACLLARTDDKFKTDLAMSRPALKLLERARQVLEEHGHTDEDCVGLLIPLSIAGFYGEIALQERYFDRTMQALWRLCGIPAADRMRRFVGARIAIVLGILFGLFAYKLRRRPLNTRTYTEVLECLATVPGAATAATACAWDVPGSFHLVTYMDRFAAMPPRSALALMRSFCIANVDLIAVRLQKASVRYAELFQIFQKPVPGMTDLHMEQFRCGCLHGQAQALVTDCSPEALVVADELSTRSPFYAPHVEGIRMAYHAYRGEAETAAVHRERAEELAFRGGTSWSATGIIILRMVQACIVTGDIVGLVRGMADLERLAKDLPHLQAIHALTVGHLELLRGHPERALAIYDRVFADPRVHQFPSYPVERALHAQALSARGDFAGARDLCLEILAETAQSGRDGEHIFLSVREQLALSEAGLGNFARAVEVLESCFERAALHGNPRSLGGVHRVRAYVAALAGDGAAFAEHFTAMSTLYASTKNPWLLQQRDALYVQAVRLGVTSARQGLTRDADGLDGETFVEPHLARSHVAAGATTVQDRVGPTLPETSEIVPTRAGNARAPTAR